VIFQTHCQLIYDRFVKYTNPDYLTADILIHNETGISMLNLNASVVKSMNYKISVGLKYS
jgi:hypothetical protein